MTEDTTVGGVMCRGTEDTALGGGAQDTALVGGAEAPTAG